MSSSKVERALYGPSWAEVIIGAALSLVLGGLLATAFLVLKPVQVVKALPKEPARGVVYYIEGSKDATKGRTWTRKHDQLVAGRSVSLNEDELNAVFGSSAAPPAPAPAAKPGPAAPADAKAALIAPGAPNFRLHDSQLQIGVPCTLNLFGISQPVMVLATGGFRKSGDGVVFDPDKYYVGSLVVSRLPFVEGFVTKKILAAESVPADLSAAWQKLTDATVDANALQLTMP